MDIKDLSLKQKIAQMFILGFSGDYKTNKYFVQLADNALGGVIFFSHNIKSAVQFKDLISQLSKSSFVPMFYSIDQEGGRVERTEKIHGGKKYLSAKYAYEKGLTFLQNQTKEIALELKSYGINMNFAPVLDVNTNENNPIIGERAFSNNTDKVIEAAKIVIKEYENNNIIAVGKHFPGHGDTAHDSHKTLPVVDLPYENLFENHIRPFVKAIEYGVNALMVAHVLYPAIEPENIPSSLSKKVVSDLLINRLNFNGIIMTDDMEMNGVKGFSRLEACKTAINSGVNMFIFRDTNKDIFELINDIEQAVNNGLIPEENINRSVEKIINVKRKYRILS